jgi:hypothetical protein
MDPLQLGDTLTDIWAANLRTWARDEHDIQLASRKISFGFACVLAGVAADPAVARMRKHITRFRKEIDTYGGVPPLGPPRRAVPPPATLRTT